jgi:protocatechuate 3,4-dioxygenase beta subunit
MTQQTLRAVFAASVLVLAPTFTATAQATLTGVVRDSAGRPLVRAEIAIEARRKSTTTDENGRYRLTDVPTGSSPRASSCDRISGRGFARHTCRE